MGVGLEQRGDGKRYAGRKRGCIEVVVIACAAVSSASTTAEVAGSCICISVCRRQL
jgi:hypothetical protein